MIEHCNDLTPAEQRIYAEMYGADPDETEEEETEDEEPEEDEVSWGWEQTDDDFGLFEGDTQDVTGTDLPDDIWGDMTVETEPEEPEDTTPINQNTGHPQVPIHYDIGDVTAENVKHVIETSGFSGLESLLGSSMPEIYESYALGNFSWQHGTTVPDWLQPNLSNIYGGAAEYGWLIKKYEHDPKMMRKLERVETATRAPNVLNYLDTAHGELRSTYHSGLSNDDISNITQGRMPDFAYNSAGHVILKDDRTIKHNDNYYRHVVNYISPSTEDVTKHHQMDFQAVAQSLAPAASKQTQQAVEQKA